MVCIVDFGGNVLDIDRIINNPFRLLSRRECILWAVSVIIVTAANLLSGGTDPLTLTATIVGATSLIFAAKGHVIAQGLMIVFSILYAIISFRFRYWGEMITYLGMTLPMAVWALIAWYRNPSAENRSEVKIRALAGKHFLLLAIGCPAVTAAFYLLLVRLNTPNIVFSTVSIATSFLAATLTALRSSYFGLAYASNDLVLIAMWILASLDDATYIPVAVNFAVFFVNDMYGFLSWKRREKKQTNNTMKTTFETKQK